MKETKLPNNFSTLNKGNITLYIKKEYENRLSGQDLSKFFNLFDGSSELTPLYQGRVACKRLSLNGLAGVNLVVRDYWHGGLFGKLLGDIFCQGARPLHELSICEAAIKTNMLTTEVVAIVKRKILGPFFKCKFITKEIANTIDLIELLLNYENNPVFEHKREIITKVGRGIKVMHDAGIYHADLHLKNILVQTTQTGGLNIFIIDLDKSKQFENVDLHKRMKNILRLDRSVEKLLRNNSNVFSKGGPLSKTDKIRFVKEYVKSGEGIDKPLRYYLQTLSSTHKYHRLWWSLTMQGAKNTASQVD